MTNKYELYMRRCLQLALNAEGATYPNPLVGSVIVYNDEIIGEGFHRKCGQAHAEVNAIAAVRDLQLLENSTLFVNLEPCAHWGRTPPCAQLIIDKKIPRVVIGCVDSFSKVAGRGIEMLQRAGVHVTTGVLDNECRLLNRRFFTFYEKKRPYVILKWAQTLDGFIDLAPERKDSMRGVWISDQIGKALVHKWRTQEGAIMVGTNTALYDNPQLTARMWPGNNPLRVVVDRQLRLPQDLALFDSSVPTVIFTAQYCESLPNIDFVTIDFEQDVLVQILHHLSLRQVQSVIVEGGFCLLSSFIKSDLWDEAYVFIGNMLFHSGVPAPKIDVEPIGVEFVGNSRLLHWMRSV